MGYFRSSFYALTAPAVAAFALRGGQIRVVCAPDFGPADIALLESGAEASEVAVAAAAVELSRILDDPESQAGGRVLKALLDFGALTIKVAATANPGTIFHDKVGLFGDHFGNTLTFSGSVNETWRAWHPDGNHESFEVFRSWDPKDADRVTRHRAFFDDLWGDDRSGVRVLDLSAAFAEQMVALGTDDPEHALVASAKPTQSKPSEGIRLQKHQIEAVDAWEANGYRGVIKHATGSGKTFTALEAVRRHVKSGRPALILVPSNLLLKQWAHEVDRFFAPSGIATVLAGAGNDGWKSNGDIGAFTTDSLAEPRIIIATLQTASKPQFLSGVEAGPHLMIVVDEVHNYGAASYRSIDAIDAGARLGVSATPERFRDPTGTSAIFDYFGPIVGPVITLEDAVRVGRLCPYDYFPHPVNLNDAEADEWREITTRIRRAAAMNGGHADDMSEQLKLLLIKRANIAKQAAAKAPLAVEILVRDFKPKQHWLVYCDDGRQLRDVLDRLRAAGLSAMEYWSGMEGDRADSLAQFERSGGIIVAIECLDEGVDIPAVSHGIILASTQNPRQFIQRRGRMLRRFDGKHYAVVHDLLLAPPQESDPDFSSLIKAELARAHEFAGSASNENCRLVIDALIAEWGASEQPDSVLSEEDDE